MKFFTLSANWGEQLWLFLQNNGPKFLLAIVVLIVGLALTKAAEKPMRRILQKSKIDASAHKLILQIVNIALKVVVLLITAETLGIKTTSLIALSAVGLAISLAVKDFLSNMTGGFLVLITHPFTKGDFIETNSVSGMVENITLFYTTLKTPDNKKIFIPNGEICTAKIVNYSAEETRRLDMVFSISYNDDLSAAKQILADLVASSGLALEDPAPAYVVTEHAASSINIGVRVWVKSADYWTLNFYMNEQVKLAFDRAHITIPFQRLDVHIDPAK